MITIALDQSSKISGFSIWNDDSLLEHGAFKTKTTYGFLQRTEQILNFINEKISKYEKYEIQIILEDIQLQDTVSIRNGNGFGVRKEEVNARTFKTLSMLLGILQFNLYKKVKIDTVQVNKWRQFIGIKSIIRSDQKAEAIQKVWELFNIEVNEDEAEAILIGYYYINKKRLI